jgi:hypothetical protein
MTYYVGQLSSVELLGEGNPRFFYGLRRQDAGTNDGTLFFTKVDQLSSIDTITINVPGAYENNFESFEYGVDFFDGRKASDHSRPYTNLQFDQYRWDSKNCYYYINAAGELIVRINQAYTYSPDQIVS